MFGMRHFDSSHEGHRAGGRHRHGRFRGFGRGRHGRHGMDGDDMMRAGRMLAHGDLRLIALALIAEQPRHGYEIIKMLEERTSDWYSPSPGIVYPTLTYLEDVGYVTAQAEGAKKLYAITEEGRAYLAQNRDLAAAILDRLAAVGERARERDDDAHRDRSMPRSIQGAFQDLSEAVREFLRQDPGAKAKVIDALDRAALDLRKQ